MELVQHNPLVAVYSFRGFPAHIPKDYRVYRRWSFALMCWRFITIQGWEGIKQKSYPKL